MRIDINIVRATLRVPRTAPRLAFVVQDAKRIPNQRLHRTGAAQPPVAPRLPVSRGAVRCRSQELCEALMSGPKSGKVKWFNPENGFGFIAQEDPTAADIFIHISAVERAGLHILYEGQEVTFEVVTTRGKSSASLIKAAVNEVLDSDNTLTLDPQETSVNIEKVKQCTNEIIRYLQADPKRLYKMHPSAFEQLVAKIFENNGFTIELNKSWNQADGGVDIIAVRMDGLVPIRTAIQCKRYSQHNRVTAEKIRELAGVLDRYRAHAGVLATTSYFTDPAVEETRNYMWRIGLHDYKEIVAGLMRLRL
jgi:cold shock CspA family protein/Holliday junction resolvase-like predicted endonuclease